MMSRLMLLIISQICLINFIFVEALNEKETIDAFKKYPRDSQVVLARFFCAIILHISMSDKLKQAFNLMKYALNHIWKFENWKVAFFIGFM